MGGGRVMGREGRRRLILLWNSMRRRFHIIYAETQYNKQSSPLESVRVPLFRLGRRGKTGGGGSRRKFISGQEETVQREYYIYIYNRVHNEIIYKYFTFSNRPPKVPRGGG